MYFLNEDVEVPRSVSVDFDGMISYGTVPYPGVAASDINSKLVGYLKAWQADGGVVILNTARRRSNGTVQPVLELLADEFGFHPDYVNQNIKEGIKKFGDCRKIVADYYLDDRNISKEDFYNLVEYGDILGAPTCEAVEGSYSKYQYLTNDLADVLQKKNDAYGNSFDKEMDEWGLSALCIRLSDKYQRIKNLVQNPDVDWNDESIYDTLKDLAGYALLGMHYLNNKEKDNGEN